MTVHVDEFGVGGAAMVLLHGFGATGAVWRRTITELAGTWDGRLLACDLPGHGVSSPLDTYSFEAVAEVVSRVLPTRRSLVVVGHSYGGVIAALLASAAYGVKPVAMVAAGVKVAWSADELAGAAAIAAKGVRWFDTWAEAENRYRKASGLTLDITDDPADLERGVTEVDGRFRLSCDPPAGAVGAPAMAGALAAARCPVLLSRGVADPMVTSEQLDALGALHLDIADAGHNVHVEQPGSFARSVLDFVTSV